jgi:very-short-patch-repair endonuclease
MRNDSCGVVFATNNSTVTVSAVNTLFIGPYIVDFACLETRLVIELDGGQHQEQAKEDRTRDEYLLKQGFHVVRFWNNQVFNETEAVLDKIAECLPGSTNNLAGETVS